MKALIKLVNTLKGTIESVYTIIEVQNSLIMEIAMDVMQLQVMAGNFEGAEQLADKFKMASEALEAHKRNRQGETDESPEEGSADGN